MNLLKVKEFISEGSSNVFLAGLTIDVVVVIFLSKWVSCQSSI